MANSKESFSKTIHTEGIPVQELYAKEYEDPRDAFYLNALKINKAFDVVVKTILEYGFERQILIQNTGSSVRVTEKNMPYLYNCVKNACEILNVGEVPKIYVCENPFINAATKGSSHPILEIHNSILHRLTHEELMFVIGHEIGHIKSEHCQYKILGSVIKQSVNGQLTNIPIIGDILSAGLSYAYIEWERRAEYTADHAGLLVCQDLKSAISALAKMGGYPIEYYDSLDANTFLLQAQEFEDLDDKLYDKILKFCMTIETDHPWTVLRARELMLWVQSREYSRIIMRNSTWLNEEIERLSKVTDKVVLKMIKKHEEAQKSESQKKGIIGSTGIEQEESIAEKGAKVMLTKSQERLKGVQSKLEAGTLKRKKRSVEEAKVMMQKVGLKEKKLREIYKDIPEEILIAHCNNTIGELIRIEDREWSMIGKE